MGLNTPTSVVVANREFEAWFIAASTSLGGMHGISENISPHQSPDSVRGAKEWLTKQMPRGYSYRETIHQAAFARSIDLKAAQSSRSFRKFYKEIELLVKALEATP